MFRGSVLWYLSFLSRSKGMINKGKREKDWGKKTGGN